MVSGERKKFATSRFTLRSLNHNKLSESFRSFVVSPACSGSLCWRLVEAKWSRREQTHGLLPNSAVQFCTRVSGVLGLQPLGWSDEPLPIRGHVIQTTYFRQFEESLLLPSFKVIASPVNFRCHHLAVPGPK